MHPSHRVPWCLPNTPAGLLSAVMAAWTRVLCGGYSHTHSYLPHF